ncbi:MAG: pirin family protein [Anaerolineae bacterium]|nr:pirin family protein [Anaerolineae bacterium]
MLRTGTLFESTIQPNFVSSDSLQHFPAESFPITHPIHWLHSHFAVGGWSPLQRLSGMLTAHMTQIAPYNGFTWHPHRGVEIYTWVLEGVLSHEDTTGGKGDIGAGELQRMFSGDWIEHQELNNTGELARVIQIWFIADPKYRGLEPHYQQIGKGGLPSARIGDATTYQLIGGGSPMESHVRGRLTATVIDPTGSTALVNPREDEDLFLYVTDGAGKLNAESGDVALRQYDVILARADAPEAILSADDGGSLHYLSFYLPRFMA